MEVKLGFLVNLDDRHAVADEITQSFVIAVVNLLDELVELAIRKNKHN